MAGFLHSHLPRPFSLSRWLTSPPASISHHYLVFIVWQENERQKVGLLDRATNQLRPVIDSADRIDSVVRSPNAQKAFITWFDGFHLMLTTINMDSTDSYTIDADTSSLSPVGWLVDSRPIMYTVRRGNAMRVMLFDTETHQLEARYTRLIRVEAKVIYNNDERIRPRPLAGFWWQSHDGTAGMDIYAPELRQWTTYPLALPLANHVSFADTLSPNGQFAVIISQGNPRTGLSDTLQIAFADGQPGKVIDLPANLWLVLFPRWSPDSSRFVYSYSDAADKATPPTLVIVSSGGTLLHRIKLPDKNLDSYHGAPQWTSCI